ncbi:MAG: AbrB family transcriptional regulator [Thermoprotei archaeon]|nr:MAG: AbrB family transcriptional regulator [Thermoprotei archaeon]
MVVKVRRKGVLILPKALRERVGIEEGDEVVAEVVGESIVLKPLKPRVVDVDVEKVYEIVREEKKEWDVRLDALAGKAGA